VNRHCLIPALIAAASVVACAPVETQPSQQASENKPDKVYTTGSRIPVKEGSGSASVRSVQGKEGVDDVMRGSGTITTAPKGSGM